MNRTCLLALILVVALVGCNTTNNAEPTASNTPNPSNPSNLSSPTNPASPANPSSPTNLANPTGPSNSTKPAPKPPGTKQQTPVTPWMDVKNPALVKALQQLKHEQKVSEQAALKIPANGTENWAPSDITPIYIAQCMDKSIAQMHNISGEIHGVIKEPDGGGGVNLDLRVLDPDTYKVEFFDFGEQPEVCEVVSNGREKMMQVGPTWNRKMRTDAVLRLPDPNTPPEAGTVDLSQKVFEPLLKTNESWTNLVQKWLAPNSGFTTHVEYRSVPDAVNGVTYHIPQVRMIVERSPDLAKSLGKSKIEVVVDATHSLPTTLRADYTNPAGKTWGVEWGCKYEHVDHFEKKDFEAPFSAKLSKPKPPAVKMEIVRLKGSPAKHRQKG